MSAAAGEPFVNFSMVKKVKKGINKRIVTENAPIDSEYEEQHLSELERRIRALDEVEDFVVINTMLENHKALFVKITDYLWKEGEKNETD